MLHGDGTSRRLELRLRLALRIRSEHLSSDSTSAGAHHIDPPASGARGPGRTSSLRPIQATDADPPRTRRSRRGAARQRALGRTGAPDQGESQDLAASAEISRGVRLAEDDVRKRVFSARAVRAPFSFCRSARGTPPAGARRCATAVREASKNSRSTFPLCPVPRTLFRSADHQPDETPTGHEPMRHRWNGPRARRARQRCSCSP